MSDACSCHRAWPWCKHIANIRCLLAGPVCKLGSEQAASTYSPVVAELCGLDFRQYWGTGNGSPGFNVVRIFNDARTLKNAGNASDDRRCRSAARDVINTRSLLYNRPTARIDARVSKQWRYPRSPCEQSHTVINTVLLFVRRRRLHIAARARTHTHTNKPASVRGPEISFCGLTKSTDRDRNLGGKSLNVETIDCIAFPDDDGVAAYDDPVGGPINDWHGEVEFVDTSVIISWIHAIINSSFYYKLRSLRVSTRERVTWQRNPWLNQDSDDKILMTSSGFYWNYSAHFNTELAVVELRIPCSCETSDMISLAFSAWRRHQILDGWITWWRIQRCLDSVAADDHLR